MPEVEKINNLLELERDITEGRISSILSKKLHWHSCHFSPITHCECSGL